MLGKFQPYALGCYLRALYEDFITSDPTEVEVMSSSRPDCVKSAQSLVTALYAPSPFWEVVQNFSWQPIFVKYDNAENAKYLSKPMCLAADKELQALFARESAPVFQNYGELLYYWKINSGWELQSLTDIELLYRILETEAAYNLTVPDWAKTYWTELKFLHDLSFVWKLKTKLQQRLRGGPLVNLIVERMQKKNSDTTDEKKVAVYSTHSINIAAFLSAMGMWNYRIPTGSTTILIELYKHEGEPFVRYLYLNSTTPEREPQILYMMTVPGCTEFCPLDYVIEYTRDVVPKNWDEECQNM